jgi:hypothetical protein
MRWRLTPHAVVIGAALGAALAAPAGGAASEAATPAPQGAPVPSDLQTLEQKMNSLEVRTARVVGRVVLPESSAPEAGKAPKDAVLTVSGEESFSPSAMETTVSVGGQPIGSSRRIGATEYNYEPSLGLLDGGRPWVRLGRREASESFGDDPALSMTQSSRMPFKALVSMLNGAGAIQELGPATVDRQPVTEFSATLKPSQLPPSARQLLSKRRGTMKLGVFISASGLPVRTVVTVSAVGHSSDATVDILAVEVPFPHLKRPPARLTITQQRLERLLHKNVVKVVVHKRPAKRKHARH